MIINENLATLLLDHAVSSPGKVALSHITETGEINTITYHDLIQKSLNVARFIKSETNEGDTVILCFPTGFDFLISFFGCMFAGVIAVPCMPPINQESAKRMNLIIKSSHAKLALSNHKILSAFKKLNLIHFLDNAFTKPLHKLLDAVHHNIKIESQNNWIAIEDIPEEKNIQPFFSNRFEEPLFLQYTSGSTSTPKGVKISLKNLMANFDMITHVTRRNGEDVNCQTWMPLYHDMGLIGTILYPLYTKGHASMMSPLDFLKNPSKWLEILTKFKSNSTGAPQFAIELILKKVSEEEAKKYDLSNIKWFFNGAEPVRYESVMKFIKRFNINENAMLPVYGLAESTLIVSGYRDSEKINSLKVSQIFYSEGKIVPSNDKDAIELISCGKASPHTQVEIIDVNTNMPLPENEIGEICISSDSVSSGYWENEKETEETFSINRAGKKIPMLRTGDLGFLHNGELYITGRKKDLLIINGRNYYPQDIEKVIEGAHENVRTGCTAAFSVAGDMSEELVVVAEVKTKPTEKEEQAIRSEIMRHFQLMPKDIKLIAPRTILKTTSGKIRRRDMRQHYMENKLTFI